MSESMNEEMKSLNIAKNIKKTVQELFPFPEFVSSRLTLFKEFQEENAKFLQTKDRTEIKVTLSDGKEISATSWQSTPMEIAKSISERLAKEAIVARVNDELWDMLRPLENSCSLQILKFDDPDAQQVFWHSSAHVLGEAMESKVGGMLCYGPPIESGFYYDMFSQSGSIKQEDVSEIEKICKSITDEKQPFERLELTKEQLLKMFEYNCFKKRIIESKIDTPTTTVYRCGPLIDLCRGPHVPHTGLIKALAVTKNSTSFWEGDSTKETLQRIYGISFPDNKQMKEYQKLMEEAAKRDHRRIGKDQNLFFFHDLSPGSCFFLPKGAHIYHKLMEMICDEYRDREFTQVISPNMYNVKLWETSGHWQNYSENMFSFEIEKEKYALKPMNCPGHCLMFDHQARSWRELPIRFADFGVLHRNELSGTLSGLTRVRRFCQDDAHIFCAPEQINSEIESCLRFLSDVYRIFGFELKLNLSTRPEKFIGEISTWDNAEKALTDALNAFGQKWFLNAGDGAFYGPKIDIQIQDALKRYHQCATIQLDFNLPERFDLKYQANDGSFKRPVIIHRAVLGSVERMMAILIENYAGKWPFWISPNQLILIPVGVNFEEYAKNVQKKLKMEGFQCDISNNPSETLDKRIRNAQKAYYNFILVVGERDQNAGAVSVRVSKTNQQVGQVPLEELICKLKEHAKSKSADDSIVFPAEST